MKRSFVELSRAAFGEMPQSQAQAHQRRDAGTHERLLFLNKGDIFPRDKKNCGKIVSNARICNFMGFNELRKQKTMDSGVTA